MCYSAQVWADYHHYVREFGADIDIREFVRCLPAPRRREAVHPEGNGFRFR